MSGDPKIRIAVYYRELPGSLLTMINKDGNMSISKDGIMKGMGHSCPRATVSIFPISPTRDKERFDALVLLLDGLESNNQIAGYTVKGISAQK